MQRKFCLNGGRHGGLREGAGRKRRKSRGVAHRIREKVSRNHLLHINFRYSKHVRNKDTLKLLKRAILNARKHGLRILSYSFQSNHVHLIVESADNAILSTGMRSLTVTMAKGLNRGRIQMERYHLHVLRSLRESRNAVQYVLFNQQRHERGTCSVINEYSSVLSLKNGLELVRKFALKHRMLLKIQKSDWVADDPQSYLGKLALLS